jgi:hypothetical protein
MDSYSYVETILLFFLPGINDWLDWYVFLFLCQLLCVFSALINPVKL